MINKAFFTLCVLLLTSFAFFVSRADAQCGTYFKPEYRAVGKIGPGNFFGSQYTLHDWTGDGRLDFWNFRQTDISGPVDIVIFPALATGYWNWDTPIVYATQLASGAHTANLQPVVRDFDGDGLIDILVVTNSGGNTTRTVHRNLGNGSLQALAPTPHPPGSNWVFARPMGYADLNGDHRLDFLYYMEDIVSTNDSINFALQNPDGSFGPLVTVLGHTTENELHGSVKAFGDFDGDGNLDIVDQSGTSPRRIRVLRNTGNAMFVLGDPQNMISLSSGVGVFDFNNDGRGDILTYGTSEVVIYYGQSDATFAPAAVTVLNNPISPNLRPVELNGDNRLDMINILDDSYEVFINNPAGGFDRTLYPRRIRNTVSGYTFSDFTGDGKADIWDSSHETKNTFGEEVIVISTNVCDPPGLTRGMNFNAYPAYDIVTWNGATGDWLSAEGNWPSTGVLTTRTFNWGTSAQGDVPAPGDYDGDMKSDHAVYRNSDGNWYVFMSATSSWYVLRFGLPGDIAVPNDYNGGGKTDIAVFRPSDGNWYIWYTETQQFFAVHWGSNGDLAVPADYDGDGKTDIGVFRPSTGDWYYMKSSDGGFGIFHWGTTGDIPIPADYDGDSRADLAVFRSGIWHILRSTNDVYAQIHWGTAGDIPILFPESGEIVHPTVFRPSTRRWYHRRYPFGVVETPSGAAPVHFGLPNN